MAPIGKPKPAILVLFLLAIVFSLLYAAYVYQKGELSAERLVKPGLELLAESRHCGPKLTVTSFQLFVWRAAVALIFFGVWFAGFFRFRRTLMTYFTLWNFTLLWMYFTVAAAFSYGSYKRIAIPRNRLCDALRVSAWISFELGVVTCVVVCIVAWTMLPLELHVFHYFWHLFNFLVFWMDFYLNSLPITVHSGAAALCAWILIYGCFTWILRQAHGRWPYPFLDYTKNSNAVMYPMLLIAHLLVFAVVFLLHAKTRRQSDIESMVATRVADSSAKQTEMAVTAQNNEENIDEV